jgi:hypothetical protein
MKFLVPVGGVTDNAFGILTTYQHHGIVAGIRAGLVWAADNCAFSDKFDADRFVTWLEGMSEWRATCLFVVTPDVVGDSQATLRQWHKWQPRLTGWPLAFVCQDGQQPQDIPVDCDVIFIGGTTTWKLSESATACIRWAQTNGKGVHIGRVNWGKRYAHFRIMKGSEHFTTDGTRTRFEGTERTLRAWKQYMGRIPLIELE